MAIEFQASDWFSGDLTAASYASKVKGKATEKRALVMKL
jgi:hypothetical protein